MWGLMIKLVPALVLVALVIPSSAFGQATRTWVSGVGDDANPCSRTAPCKTFAGAISKTANGGEINCLDPGGFGGVTITKSLTIKCQYTEGGVLVSGTNAIVVNATATDKVVLRGLDINGIGTGAPTSLVGVKVLSARHVSIRDSEIYRFKCGVCVVPTSAATNVSLSNNHIHNNDIGVLTAPGSNAITFAATRMKNNDIEDNVCGAIVSSQGANASTPTTTDCGTSSSASGISKPAVLSSFGNAIFDNGTGVLSRGASSVFEAARSEIIGNTVGLSTLDAGVLRTFTPATNVVSNNGSSTPFNSSTPMQRPIH
jgi:hypothetical protein